MRVFILCMLVALRAKAQQPDSLLLSKILSSSHEPILKQVIAHAGEFRVQIIYTQINRDARNRPSFHDYFFHVDPNLYFNPASMVKMPLAFLSLEKLHHLPVKSISKFTTMQFDSSQPWQHPFTIDTTAAGGHPSLAQFIRRAFLISENDPYNRMYQFMGQGAINGNLHDKGYPDVRIVRQFLGLTAEQNRYTNAIRFLGDRGQLLYAQPPAVNEDTINFSRIIKIGKAYYNSKDSLINEPFDFTRQNNVSLHSFQQMLQSVLFPSSVPAGQRFDLKRDDYQFLKQYLSQFPSETPYPKYDTSQFYDSYVKFFFRGSTHRMPDHVRVFNKVGWSYGFLTDVSYVADFQNKVEYMLAATIYVNSDSVLNDDRYEYDSIGHPFLYQLGQTIYQYELRRKRKYRPDLSDFIIRYENRDPADTRPSLKEVDN